MYFINLSRKYFHSTFFRVKSVNYKLTTPPPPKKRYLYIIYKKITFKATAFQKKRRPPISFLTYFSNICFIFEYFEMVPRRLHEKLGSLNTASRKSLKIQENQIFPLESTLDQLLSGLILLLRNSRVALFSLFVTLPLSLKLCISFFSVTERCFNCQSIV